MSKVLDGKVAIVTGAASGLGRTLAEALAANGASVTVTDLDGDGAKVAADEIAKATGQRTLGMACDIGDDDAIAATVEATVKAFGGIDILMNNAGLARGKWSGGMDLTTDEWTQIFRINVIAQINFANAVRPHMKARGGGSIINQSSQGAYSFINSAYSVTKRALSTATVALANQFGVDNIRVNGLAPGMMGFRVPQEHIDMVLNSQMLHRRGSANDLVGALIYLASDASSFVTAQTLIIDGGSVERP